MTVNHMWTMRLPAKPDYSAPDGSQIRLLPTTPNGGLAHCTLGRARTSKAVRHKRVEEIWFFLSGKGEVWRKYGSCEEVVPVESGSALIISYQTRFQFRNTGNDDLVFVICTMPGWPGPDEAVEVVG